MTGHPHAPSADEVGDAKEARSAVVITLRGVAGPTVRQAFDGIDVDVTVEGTVTKLRSRTSDQSTLHGLLQRAQDFGMEVLEVHVESADTH
jgi:hypothetical protein